VNEHHNQSRCACDQGLFHVGIGQNTNYHISGNSTGNSHGGAARSDVGPRVTHILGIVVVNFRVASGKTLYWVLLLA
jgi:hypothetical protein